MISRDEARQLTWDLFEGEAERRQKQSNPITRTPLSCDGPGACRHTDGHEKTGEAALQVGILGSISTARRTSGPRILCS